MALQIFNINVFKHYWSHNFFSKSVKTLTILKVSREASEGKKKKVAIKHRAEDKSSRMG